MEFWAIVRRKSDIEAARAIFKRSGCAVELQSHSVADPPCTGMCCPLCGKTGIRLVAFTDAAGVLHMIGVGPMPFDSSGDLLDSRLCVTVSSENEPNFCVNFRDKQEAIEELS